MGSVGDVWMLEYETYIKEKRLERHSLRKDEIYLREAYRRAKAEQRREARRGSRDRLSRLFAGAILAKFQRH